MKIITLTTAVLTLAFALTGCSSHKQYSTPTGKMAPLASSMTPAEQLARLKQAIPKGMPMPGNMPQAPQNRQHQASPNT